MKLVLILNAVVVAVARERPTDVPAVSSKAIMDKKEKRDHDMNVPVSKKQEKVHKEVEAEEKSEIGTFTNSTTGDQVPEWEKYTEGDPGDWKKYLKKPDMNGKSDESNFDWMKYAEPYIGGLNSTNTTGGETSFDWNKYAAPYMAGNYSGSNDTTTGGAGGAGDWQQYAGKYMGGAQSGSNDTAATGGAGDWQQYAGKYMGGAQSGSTGGAGGSGDWQQYAGKYMGGAGGATGGNTTQWNGGQGDGFGEPFRSQTGGDFRYKAGRSTGGVNPAQPGTSSGASGASDYSQYMGGGSTGGFDWQQYAGKYMGGSNSTNTTTNSTAGGSDWQQYMGGSGGSSGGFDWQQYAGKYMGGASNATANSTTGGASDYSQYMGGAGGSAGGFDWQQYAGKYMGGGATPSAPSTPSAAPSAGGYFELSVTGTDLNVTTSFGLGQGAGNNSTGDGGGGGNQNSIVAKDDIVHNDECVFTFNTPFSNGGLYVNLNTWEGVSPDFFRPTKDEIYAHLEYTLEPIPKEDQPEASVLGLNVTNGFSETTTRILKNISIFKDLKKFDLNDLSVSPEIRACADAVVAHQGAREQGEVASWEAQEEVRPVSEYAENLAQEAGKQISMDPKNWKCELTGSTDNLWLNLSDGFIGSGRRNFDGTGGTNGAMDHYISQKQLGKNYPLVVKLGTISADSNADVYSYAPNEDCMVIDPHLTRHLAHWGIDRSQMKKSGKTMAELEVSLNKDFAFDKIIESGQVLVPVSLPGMKNMGNTCYLNSICQLLVHQVEIFREKFGDKNGEIRKQNSDKSKFCFQLAKLSNALLYSSSAESITPFTFRKSLLPEFQSARQQDAVEFLLYFFKLLDRDHIPISPLFTFQVQDKLVCGGKSKFSIRNETILSIQPEAGEESVKKMKLDLFTKVFAPNILEGFRSPLTGEIATDAFKSFAPLTMPRYLLISVNRYVFTPTFEPAKLDIAVPMPQVLDMEPYRATKGVSDWPDETMPEAGQELLSMGFPEPLVKKALEHSDPMAWILDNPEMVQDDGSVDVLVGMGFTPDQAREALAATCNNLERAADWLFSRDFSATETTVDDGPGIYDLVGMVSHIGKSTSTGHYVAHLNIEGEWVMFNDELVGKSNNPPLDYGYLYLYKRK